MNVCEPCASSAHEGGFVAGDTQWTFAGSLLFADAAAVFAAAQALPLPASGIVDLAGLEQADSAALAVMLALKRRAAASGVRLQFASIPQGLATLASVYGVEELLAG
jgi:phospholipid transport system transporter-binding protein